MELNAIYLESRSDKQKTHFLREVAGLHGAHDRRGINMEELMQNPIVNLTINSKILKIELYPEIAPNTVANFIELATQGYYDGLIFHRVIPGFMIQGGDPMGTGTGGPGHSIFGEFSSNGFKNDLKHERGVISMARSMMPNSAGSQFFIMHNTYPSLDGEYAAFGKVIDGIEIIDEVASCKTNSQDKPLENQTLDSITVETFGVEYLAEKK